MKYVFGTIGFLGFMLMLGVAGSDCDGKCMERAMSLTDTLLYGGIGCLAFAIGVLGSLKYED